MTKMEETQEWIEFFCAAITKTCPTCKGSRQQTTVGFGNRPNMIGPCSGCNATGRIPSDLGRGLVDTLDSLGIRTKEMFPKPYKIRQESIYDLL